MKLVYRYGLHAPHEGADLVRDQMRAAHQYRNALVQIERGRRDALRAVEAEAGDLAAASLVVDAAREQAIAASRAIAKHRAQSRKRDEPPALREALRAARQIEREAVARARDVRRAIVESPAVQAARDVIGERAKALARGAYALSGAYWGQRAIVDEAASDSFADTPMFDAAWQPNDPKFVRWSGDGAVGLQIMSGISVDELYQCADTRLRLRPPDARAWNGRRSDRRRYGSTAELFLRVGSIEREPLWARWICDMDRPLPKLARIVWATVHVAQRGPHSEWSLCLTLDVPDAAIASRDRERREMQIARAQAAGREAPEIAWRGGAVALDVGWRVEGDALRVAAWRDEHGEGGALRLDASTLKLLRSAHAIRGERDRRFAGALLGLRWWMGWQSESPDWLREATTTLAQWRSPARLVALWRRWGEMRFAGDERVYDQLTCWYWRDRQSWSAETKNSLQAHRRRREIYRVFAVGLARRYDVVVLERFDKRRVAVRQPNAEQRENETARSNRQLAATSELCECIVQACKTRGRTCVGVDASDSTRTCPSCGLVDERDAAGSIVLLCECGHTWDQDLDGAAPVLLARWRERPGDAKMLAGSRNGEKDNESEAPQESRWARVRRLRAEKEIRMGTARGVGDKGAE